MRWPEKGESEAWSRRDSWEEASGVGARHTPSGVCMAEKGGEQKQLRASGPNGFGCEAAAPFCLFAGEHSLLPAPVLMWAWRVFHIRPAICSPLFVSPRPQAPARHSPPQPDIHSQDLVLLN